MANNAKVVIRDLVERVFNAQDPDAAVGLIAPDVVDHSAPPGAPAGLAGMQARWTMFFGAFPDLHLEITNLLAEGDLVSLHTAGRARHLGELFGIPATGLEVRWEEISISRIRDGVMVEHWAARDSLAILRQLGVDVGPRPTAAVSGGPR